MTEIKKGDKVQVVRLQESYWKETLNLPFPEIENRLVGRAGRVTRKGVMRRIFRVRMENREIRERLENPLFIREEIRKVPLLAERVRSYSERGTEDEKVESG